MTTRTMHVDTSVPTDIIVTREFDASVDLVWAAHTEPRHLTAWCLGPDGWDMTVCETDLRVGGRWRYGWARSTDGSDYFELHGEYLEVEPLERIVQTQHFGDNLPMLVILTFAESDGMTTLTMVMRLPDEASRDAVIASGMTGGMAIGYDRLDTVLASLPTSPATNHV